MSTVGKRLVTLERATYWAHRILADELGVVCTPEWVAGIEGRIATLHGEGQTPDAIIATLAGDLGVTVEAFRAACHQIKEVRHGHAR